MVHIQRILCPIDFSDFSRHALDYAIALAKRYRAGVSVLYVHRLAVPTYAVGPYVTPNTFDPLPLTDRERTDLLNALHDTVAGDRRAGVPIDTLLEEDISVPESIVAHAKDMHPDLIVLGTHGRSGFRRLMLGSVTEKVLRTAPCPVLTVPPRSQEPAPAAAFRRIICPLDFSPSSAPALDYAASLAQESGARLTVVHIVEVPPQLSELGAADFANYRASRFDAARGCLAKAISPAMREACTIDELVLAGTAYREILRLADDQQADVIVMGVRGRGAADLLFFGSTTQHVVRQAACPVLTVRDQVES